MQKICLPLLLCAAFLSACERPAPGQVVTVGAYTMMLGHEPDPLQVGFDARLHLTINDRDGQPRRDCTASFRQFMPGMDMIHDNDVTAMPMDNNGVYSGATASFSMGGEWVLDVMLDCGEGVVNHPFTYQLEWPE